MVWARVISWSKETSTTLISHSIIGDLYSETRVLNGTIPIQIVQSSGYQHAISNDQQRYSPDARLLSPVYQSSAYIKAADTSVQLASNPRDTRTSIERSQKSTINSRQPMPMVWAHKKINRSTITMYIDSKRHATSNPMFRSDVSVAATPVAIHNLIRLAHRTEDAKSRSPSPTTPTTRFTKSRESNTSRPEREQRMNKKQREEHGKSSRWWYDLIDQSYPSIVWYGSSSGSSGRSIGIATDKERRRNIVPPQNTAHSSMPSVHPFDRCIFRRASSCRPNYSSFSSSTNNNKNQKYPLKSFFVPSWLSFTSLPHPRIMTLCWIAEVMGL